MARRKDSTAELRQTTARRIFSNIIRKLLYETKVKERQNLKIFFKLPQIVGQKKKSIFTLLSSEGQMGYCLRLSCRILKNGLTYFKNLAVRFYTARFLKSVCPFFQHYV